MRRLPIIVVAVLALGALSGVAAVQTRPSSPEDRQQLRWQEIAWPFPRDGWPAGRAFRCATEACGGTFELYVRPKLGFCNCDSGVADDEEVDRVTDLDLISERFAPLQPGRPVRFAGMAGRSRNYDLGMADGTHHVAVGIAVSHRCDLLVAVVQGSGTAPDLQRAALAHLASSEIHDWMMAGLGGP